VLTLKTLKMYHTTMQPSSSGYEFDDLVEIVNRLNIAELNLSKFFLFESFRSCRSELG